jgi:hypothetical protein
VSIEEHGQPASLQVWVQIQLERHIRIAVLLKEGKLYRVGLYDSATKIGK